MNKIISMEQKFLANNYKSLPVVLSKGKDIFLYDVEGKQYYDFLSSYSANNQGHCHPKILEIMIEQSSKLTLTSRAFHNDLLYQFGEKITSTFGYDKVLPMNTGVEAGETAIKIARKWGYEVKGVHTNQATVLFPKNNFWGRTISASSTQNDKDSYNNFGPFTPKLNVIDYNNLDDLEQHLINPDVVAYFLEPIQGEAGVIIPDPHYLFEVKELCDKYDVLMIADEVQTGMGRTGNLTCCDNIKPDILLLGKALSGGFMPVSAVLSSSKIMDVITPGTHGSTFGGNPLGCAIAMKSIDVLIEENMIENSKLQGIYLRKILNEIKNNSETIIDVRGKGLMNAIELINKVECDELILNLMNKGVLCKSTKDNIIRLSPPLTITKNDIDNVLEIFNKVVK